MPYAGKLGPSRTCASCGEFKPHHSRHLCNACYKRYQNTGKLDQFPPVRTFVSARARYEAWVASGMRPGDYAREIGVWPTSLSRALRTERERLRRRGLPWVDGWRKVHND